MKRLTANWLITFDNFLKYDPEIDTWQNLKFWTIIMSLDKAGWRMISMAISGQNHLVRTIFSFCSIFLCIFDSFFFHGGDNVNYSPIIAYWNSVKRVTAILKFQCWGNFYFEVTLLEGGLQFEGWNLPNPWRQFLCWTLTLKRESWFFTLCD